MLVMVWFYAMMSAVVPSGDQLARFYVNAIEDQYRAIVEQRSVLADEIADWRNA